MPRLRALVAVGACVLAVSATSTAAYADPPAPPGTPTATTFAGTPTVGPIFRDGLANDHECTASVIASPSRDLILTAAHCVYGDVSGWKFVPGYRKGKTPYGVWTIKHAYVDPSWVSKQDPQHDYAILTVAPHGKQRVQDVVGANVLGFAPHSGATITDIAYNAGIKDRPIRCTTKAYNTHGYPTFNCHGYVGGSSGSPWLWAVPHSRLRVVTGVIGGLHQGGCYEYTSYSSSFDKDVYRLLLRAALHRTPDTPPQPGSDGC